MGLTKARVVHFQFCSLIWCPYAENGPHLLVRTELVELKRGNATAISYAWGEFNRQRRVVGHFEDGRPVTLELGEEWEHDDLIRTLQQLCLTDETQSPHAGSSKRCCWMDQLSLAQDDAKELRESLSSRPDIYRNLDVVVLLSGGICECSKRMTTLWNHDRDNKASRAEKSAFLAQVINEGFCVGSLAYSLWFSRLWTRQELIYARNIRFQWMTEDVFSCSRLSSDVNPQQSDDWWLTEDKMARLVPAARLLIARITQKMGSADLTEADRQLSILEKYEIEASTGMKAVTRGIKEKIGFIGGNKSGFRTFVTIYDLLGGKVLDTSLQPSSLESKRASVARTLCNLGTCNRAATKTRDYILAVWVDCPDYQIPKNFIQMESWQLFEDAVQQLETHHHLSVPALIPGGVFGDESRTALWTAKSIQGSTQPVGTSQIYGTLFGDLIKYPVLADGSVPLMIRPAPHPMQKSLVQYQTFLGPSSPTDAFEFVVQCALNFSAQTLFRLQQTVDDLTAKSNLIDAEAVFNDYLTHLSLRTQEQFALSISQQCGGLPTDTLHFWTSTARWNPLYPVDSKDHEALAYALTARTLGIDSYLACSYGMQLVVEPGSGGRSPRMGLFRSDFDFCPNSKTYTILCANPKDSDVADKGLQYEAVEVNSIGDRRALKVVGTWIPQVVRTLDEFDGFVRRRGRDGVLI